MAIDVTLGGAAVAGLLSFVSPCVLPLVPPYLCFLAGVTLDELTGTEKIESPRLRVVGTAIAFVAGFSLVFVLLGSLTGAAGAWLFTHTRQLNVVLGVITILLGVAFLGGFGFLQRDWRIHRVPAVGLAAAPLIGFLFGVGWTPCVGPFLAGLLGLASQEQTVGQGMLLLFAYGLGLGLPFMLAGLGLEQALRLSAALRPHLRAVEISSGLLLIAMGLLLLTDRLSAISIWLTRVFGTGLAQ